MKRAIALICLLIITIGGLYLFLPEPTVSYRKPKEDTPLSLSIHNPQQTLLFLELINEKNTLTPDWYELINPITFVIANGMIKSVTGYLFLDISQPMHAALIWEDTQQYPTILFSLPSQQGVQGAENLRRNLKPYGEILQHNFQLHGNIQFPQLPKTSLSWEGTKNQILLAWRPFPSDKPFTFSSFVPSSEIPKGNIIRIKTKNSPFQNTDISTLKLITTITSKTLKIEGSGTWNYTPIPKPSYPLEMIAGWNIPGVKPIQVHKKQDSGLCFAGAYKAIQKHLNIQEKCPITETKGIFMFFSQDFFSHIAVPLKHIELSAWGTSETFTIQGSLLKKESRGLFPFYVWLHSLL